MKVAKLSDAEILEQLKLIQEHAESKAKEFRDELFRREQEASDIEKDRLDLLDTWVCANVEGLLKFVPEHDRYVHRGEDLTKTDEEIIWNHGGPQVKCTRCALLRIQYFGFKDHVLILSVEPREE